MNAVDRIRKLTRRESWIQRKLEREELLAAYRDLSIPQGQELARYALTLGDRESAEEILLCLACLVPGALDGIHGELLAREWFYLGELFRGADAATRDRLFEMLHSEAAPDSVMPTHCLVALAWIGDESVQSQFRDWQGSPPRWRPYLHVPPEDYAREGGWELTRAGDRRDLVHRECYHLAVADEPIIGAEGECAWCGLPLVTLFGFDLRDPRVAFLGLTGENLRIATCMHCVIFTPVFADIDCAGRSSWSNFNLRPTHSAFHRRPVLEDRNAWLAVVARPRTTGAIGKPRKTPNEAHQFVTSWLGLGVSQVGGHPMWIHDAEYPCCSRCRRTMMFVAQVSNEPDGDQVVYAYLCPPCGLAATVHQST